MRPMYFVISVNDDGIYICDYTEQKFLEWINDPDIHEDEMQFHNSIPDLENISEGYTVIKGNIVQPKPVTRFVI